MHRLWSAPPEEYDDVEDGVNDGMDDLGRELNIER